MSCGGARSVARFRDHRDTDAFLSRGSEISFRIAKWIDDDRLPRLLAGDEVGGLGEAVVIETTEEHGDEAACCL